MRVLGTSIVVLSLVAVSLVYTPSFAQGVAKRSRAAENGRAEEMAALRNAFKERERELAVVIEHRDALERELASVGERLSAKEAERVSVERELKKIDIQLAEWSAKRAEREKELSAQESQLSQRARALYTSLKYPVYLQLVAGGRSMNELVRSMSLLSLLVESDQKLVEQSARLVNEAQRELDESNRLRAERDRGRVSLEHIERALQDERAARDIAVLAVTREESRLEAEVEKLSLSIEKLHRLVSKSEDAEPEVQTPTFRIDASSQTIPQQLMEYRLQLSAPVSGAVVERFGRQKHEHFKETIVRNGLEYAAAPGSSVAAVDSGRVVVSEEVPLLGKVVIIDHGKRFFSLYGRLDSVNKSPGEQVKRGVTVGQLGPGDSAGRNFYFELRYGGKPLDPSLFLKPSG